MTLITLWQKLSEHGALQHNHIEDSHSVACAPSPQCNYQAKAWQG